MIKVVIPSVSLYDEKANLFSDTKQWELQLEHSLVSLSKWESIHKKPFLSSKDLTREETIDYIRCMTITQNVDYNAYVFLPQGEINRVIDYIGDPMTATTIREEKGNTNRQVITSELIYYWMTVFQIDWEAQRWHLNRLLTLIKVCNAKNQPKKKLNQKEHFKRQREENAARKVKYGTSG